MSGESAAGGQIKCVSPCMGATPDILTMHPDEKAKSVSVKVVNSEGKPITRYPVEFSVDEKTIANLAARETHTDLEGKASMPIHPGGKVGKTDVTVSVENSDINDLEFAVSVATSDQSQLHVVANLPAAYIGKVDPLSVKLFEDESSCRKIKNAYRRVRQGRNPNLADSIAQISKEDPGVFQRIKDTFGVVDKNEKYVVLAEAKRKSGNLVQMGYGCVETGLIKNEEHTIELGVRSHIPYITGTYEVKNNFNLLSMLSAKKRRVIKLIGRLFSAPGKFFFNDCSFAKDRRCTTGMINKALNELDDSSDSDILGILEKIIDTTSGSLAKFMTTWLQATLDQLAPRWLNDGYDLIGDIERTLRQFRVRGKIRINDIEVKTNPKRAVVSSAKQVWNTYQIKWTGNCDAGHPRESLWNSDSGNCETRSISIPKAISGQFEGVYVAKSNELKIQKHSLQISYGAILFKALTKLVLPKIFGSSCGPNGGESCDSFAGLFRKVFNCHSSAIPSGLQNSCLKLTDGLAENIAEIIEENLSIDSGSLTMRTPPDESCKLYPPSEYPSDGWRSQPLPYTQRIGLNKKRASAVSEDLTCEWDIDFKLGGEQKQITGSFYGARPAAD